MYELQVVVYMTPQLWGKFDKLEEALRCAENGIFEGYFWAKYIKGPEGDIYNLNKIGAVQEELEKLGLEPL